MPVLQQTKRLYLPIEFGLQRSDLGLGYYQLRVQLVQYQLRVLYPAGIDRWLALLAQLHRFWHGVEALFLHLQELIRSG